MKNGTTECLCVGPPHNWDSSKVLEAKIWSNVGISGSTKDLRPDLNLIASEYAVSSLRQYFFNLIKTILIRDATLTVYMETK